MDIIEEKKETRRKLSLRVKKCRSELTRVGVKNQIKDFCIKYPEYIDTEKENQFDRVSNLFYGKSVNIDFTTKIEAFTEYKINEYK